MVNRTSAGGHAPLLGRLGQPGPLDQREIVMIHVVDDTAVEAHLHAPLLTVVQLTDLDESHEIGPEAVGLLHVAHIEHQMVEPPRCDRRGPLADCITHNTLQVAPGQRIGRRRTAPHTHSARIGTLRRTGLGNAELGRSS
jgi:hypothetical protein